MHDHNHWKGWPHWAKGGSIGAGIAFLFIIFQLIFVPSFFFKICGEVSCVAPFARFIEDIFTNSLMPLWSSPLANSMLNYQFVYVVSVLAYYFVIGAFVGLMVEKLRKA
ncbi:MAG: hypothetical protein WCO48_00995 [Candidatus Taylorbacteria bacterium]